MYRLTDVTKDYPKGRDVVHALQSPMSCEIMAPVSIRPALGCHAVAGSAACRTPSHVPREGPQLPDGEKCPGPSLVR